MIRMSRLAGRIRSGTIGSSMAMALALCAGTAIVTTAFSTSAHAQDEKNLSKGFKRAAGPVAEAYGKSNEDAEIQALVNQIAAADGAQRSALVTQLDATLGGVVANIDKMVAAIENADDRAVAGQYIVNLGAKLADQRLQQRGLILQIEGGYISPEQVGRFSQYIGRVAFATRDYATARKYLTMELNAGGVAGGDGGLRLIDSYFSDQKDQEGIEFILGLQQSNPTAFAQIGENTIRTALQKAYDTNRFNEMGRLLLMLDSRFPSADSQRFIEALPAQFASGKPFDASEAARFAAAANDPRAWNMAITAVLVASKFTESEAVDGYRLMQRTGGLRSSLEYKRLLRGVGPNVYPTEAEKIINAGVQAGFLSLDDEDVIGAQERIEDGRGADTDYLNDADVLADARKSTDGRVPRALGNTAYSLGNYALAKEMFQLSLAKSDTDADLLQLRVGISELMLGDKATAEATLGGVSGKYAPVAQLWLAYGQAN